MVRRISIGLIINFCLVVVLGYCFWAALALNQIEIEDYIMVKAKEFGAVDNAIKIEFGVQTNGSGPCLRVSVPFEEGEEKKMVAVGKLIEILLRELGIITDVKSNKQPDGPANVGKFTNHSNLSGLPHWAARTCYNCGDFKWFGGLCRECKGYCPGCGVPHVRGQMCNECKETAAGPYGGA